MPIFKAILKRIGAWGLSAILVVIIAVFIQTQNVIAKLSNIGADISLGERLSMSLYDIHHLGSLYGIFIAIALCIAFLAAGLVYRSAKFGRPVIYIVAGASAMVIMLFAMKELFFDVHFIAGARDAFGIFMQMLAGGFGGFVFAKLTSPQPAKVS